MFERIMEIIVFVISELRNNKSLKEIDVNKLQKQGYTNSEISAAFSWLVDKVELSDSILSVAQTNENSAYRILHEAEQDLFTKDAWGELLQYQSLGLIKNDQIENIIEQALVGGTQKVSRPVLKKIVANLLFQQHSNGETGSRYMLSGSDSIN